MLKGIPLEQTVFAAPAAIVPKFPPQNPAPPMGKVVPPVLDGDGMIAQSAPVAVLAKSDL